jgi:fructose-bisphosphate aldolase class I
MTTPLSEIVAKLFAGSKGILAADESIDTMNKRLREVGVEDTAEKRRDYRDLLFTTPGVSESISGVILYDETIRQQAKNGVPFSHMLEHQGIIPGIKVDKGKRPLPNFPNEEVSEGLDGLSARLTEYYEMGARFAKWRAVVPVGNGIPTDAGLHANVHALARYAALCQEAHIVPMVEPEVLYDGAHTIAESRATIERTMHALFDELVRYRIDLSGLILKTSMALSGHDAPEAADTPSIARETVAALVASVPKEVGGVVFLSGGQTPVAATEHLQAIMAIGPHPWPITFSYARALQEPVLLEWRGDAARIESGQHAFAKRLELNCRAREAAYRPEMEA